jgi:hypothetical protein
LASFFDGFLDTGRRDCVGMTDRLIIKRIVK